MHRDAVINLGVNECFEHTDDIPVANAQIFERW
jgi:hypothetical protein